METVEEKEPESSNTVNWNKKLQTENEIAGSQYKCYLYLNYRQCSAGTSYHDSGRWKEIWLWFKIKLLRMGFSRKNPNREGWEYTFLKASPGIHFTARNSRENKMKISPLEILQS